MWDGELVEASTVPSVLVGARRTYIEVVAASELWLRDNSVDVAERAKGGSLPDVAATTDPDVAAILGIGQSSEDSEDSQATIPRREGEEDGLSEGEEVVLGGSMSGQGGNMSGQVALSDADGTSSEAPDTGEDHA